MNKMQDRDEDEVLDEQHEVVHKSIERGESVETSEDDRAFIQLANELYGEDVAEDVIGECGVEDEGEIGGDESSDENDQSHMPYSDEIDNDPKPREDRDGLFKP